MITVMMYTRAAASDYDDWERKYNNPGWGFKDLLPLLQKVLTGYHISVVGLFLYCFRPKLLTEVLLTMALMVPSEFHTERVELMSQMIFLMWPPNTKKNALTPMT
jgi:hypothetical protein